MSPMPWLMLTATVFWAAPKAAFTLIDGALPPGMVLIVNLASSVLP